MSGNHELLLREHPLSPYAQKVKIAPREKGLPFRAAARRAVAAGVFKRQCRDHRLEWMLRSGGVEIVLEGMKAGNIRFGTELS